MIEVFKTNIQDSFIAEEILSHLHTQFVELKFTIDLDDCDRILRAVGNSIDAEEIIRNVTLFNHSCSILDY